MLRHAQISTVPIPRLLLSSLFWCVATHVLRIMGLFDILNFGTLLSYSNRIWGTPEMPASLFASLVGMCLFLRVPILVSLVIL